MVPIHQRSIPSLNAAVQSGALTCLHITEHYLARIAKHNPVLNCYLHVDADRARQAAEAADARRAQGKSRGILDGIPVAIKNNIDIAGLPTTAGIAARRHYIAQTDAPVISQLKNAGAVMLGTLNMHEAALGATTDNVAYGRCHNPHKIGFTPGGSSGGSGSAVAAGLCAAALGTDTLGSIRIPSSFCGIYGLKPTNGLISTDGTVPMTHRFDCVGPMARHLNDIRALWSVMASQQPVAQIKRIARLASIEEAPQETAVRDAYQLAVSLLEGLEYSLEKHRFNEVNYAKVLQAGLVITERDALDFHRADIAQNPDGFTADLRTFLAFGEKLSADDVAAANALVDQAAQSVHAILQACDAVILPVTPCLPFSFDRRMPDNMAHFTMLANMAGLPSIVVPCGWSDEGLPVGVQIMGRKNSEAALLDVATQLDAAAKGYHFPVDFDDEGENA